MTITTLPRAARVSTRIKDLPLIKRDRVRRIKYLWADLSRAGLTSTDWYGGATLSVQLLSERYDETPETEDKVIVFDGTRALRLGRITKLGTERELPANAGFLRVATMRLMPFRSPNWEKSPWTTGARKELKERQRALAQAGLLQAEGAGVRVATFCKNPMLAESIASDILFDFIDLDPA